MYKMISSKSLKNGNEIHFRALQEDHFHLTQ